MALSSDTRPPSRHYERDFFFSFLCCVLRGFLHSFPTEVTPRISASLTSPPSPIKAILLSPALISMADECLPYSLPRGFPPNPRFSDHPLLFVLRQQLPLHLPRFLSSQHPISYSGRVPSTFFPCQSMMPRPPIIANSLPFVHYVRR